MKRRKRRARGKVDLRKIRTTSTYEFKDIAKLFGYSLDGVRRWKREGLPLMPETSPALIHGAELKAWLEARQKARKQPCAPDEIYCFGSPCRQPRRPKAGSVRIKKSNQRIGKIEAQCEICGQNMVKGFAMTNIAEIEKTYESFKGNIEDLYWLNNPPLKVVSKG